MYPGTIEAKTKKEQHNEEQHNYHQLVLLSTAWWIHVPYQHKIIMIINNKNWKNKIKGQSRTTVNLSCPPIGPIVLSFTGAFSLRILLSTNLVSYHLTNKRKKREKSLYITFQDISKLQWSDLKVIKEDPSRKYRCLQSAVILYKPLLFPIFCSYQINPITPKQLTNHWNPST